MIRSRKQHLYQSSLNPAVETAVAEGGGGDEGSAQGEASVAGVASGVDGVVAEGAVVAAEGVGVDTAAVAAATGAIHQVAAVARSTSIDSHHANQGKRTHTDLMRKNLK